MSDVFDFITERVSGGKLAVRVKNGQVRFADKCDPGSETSRKRLLKRLGDQLPELDTDDIEQRILQAADVPAPTQAKEDELPDPSEAGDATLAETPQAVRDDALRMLKSPDLIERVCRDIATVGVVGEHALALTVYLVGVSRLLAKPLAAIIQGGSSSGKSHVVETTSSMFPDEVKLMATDLTPNALYYLTPGSLRHRFVVGGERSRVEDDDRAEATRSLREMLSGGCLRKVLPVKNGDTIETKVIASQGPIAFIETTTLATIFEEDANRAILLASDDGERQTDAVVNAIAARYAGSTADAGVDQVLQLHHAAQRMLRRVEVVVPFAPAIASKMPKDRPEARRAIHQVMAAVQAIALLHQFQRTDNPQHGTVIEASLADYRCARTILAEPLARALGNALPDHVASFAEWLQATVQSQAFTVKSLQGRDGCRWSRASLYDLVKPLQGCGFLADAGMDGRSQMMRVAGPLPDLAVTWLPDPEAL
tara:strand:- start:14084 stop:15529 length:1446 start_codon:yes stop_codon:yes gene_type:complete